MRRTKLLLNIKSCIMSHFPNNILFVQHFTLLKIFKNDNNQIKEGGGHTGLMVRASDSASGDPGSILGRVGVLFP